MKKTTPLLNKQPLNKKVIWITGASQGIGRATALEAARQGATVVATARNYSNLSSLQLEAAELPGIIIPLTADVTDQSSVESAADFIRNRFGRIDQAILNAGTYIQTPGPDFHSSHMRQHFELNVMGVCYCLDTVIPMMIQQQSGVIAINSSLAGYRGLPASAAYGATKAALINMSESLAIDLHGYGVSVKVINPGFVKTPLTDKNEFPMPFMISSEEAARKILSGIHSSSFEIRFPALFGLIMATLKALPYRAYFYLMRKMV